MITYELIGLCIGCRASPDCSPRSSRENLIEALPIQRRRLSDSLQEQLLLMIKSRDRVIRSSASIRRSLPPSLRESRWRCDRDGRSSLARQPPFFTSGQAPAHRGKARRASVSRDVQTRQPASRWRSPRTSRPNAQRRSPRMAGPKQHPSAPVEPEPAAPLKGRASRDRCARAQPNFAVPWMPRAKRAILAKKSSRMKRMSIHS